MRMPKFQLKPFNYIYLPSYAVIEWLKLKFRHFRYAHSFRMKRKIRLLLLLLINELSRNYRCVRFVNLSMSSLGVFSDECSTFFDMMNDIGIDKKQQRYIIKKMINIAIRATYYIFCSRNRNWDSPDLMQFWYFFLLLALICFVFVFAFFFRLFYFFFGYFSFFL